MRGDDPTIAYRNNSSPSWLNTKKERERTRKAVSGDKRRWIKLPRHLSSDPQSIGAQMLGRILTYIFKSPLVDGSCVNQKQLSPLKSPNDIGGNTTKHPRHDL